MIPAPLNIRSFRFRCGRNSLGLIALWPVGSSSLNSKGARRASSIPSVPPKKQEFGCFDLVGQKLDSHFDLPFQSGLLMVGFLRTQTSRCRECCRIFTFVRQADALLHSIVTEPINLFSKPANILGQRAELQRNPIVRCANDVECAVALPAL